MLIPSIDLQGGNAVQLEGGRELRLDAGDPRPLADRFGRVGEVAVIDLDAALGEGDNQRVIRELVTRARCRVGGGIRDAPTALRWLDAGAERVILGTAAKPEILRELPRERVIVALDAVQGDVVVEGWRRKTGRGVIEQMRALREFAGGFLVTAVEREGRMGGIDLEFAERLAAETGGAALTVAGGTASVEEIARLDALGIDVQVGMALYTGAISLADGFLAPIRQRLGAGPWPTVVCDESGRALGLVHSNGESVAEALDSGRGIYHSRRRGLWIKGESSGATQELVSVSLDCDRDALRFVVRQEGPGFCHRGTWNCWGEDAGLPRLSRRLVQRVSAAEPGSYTRRLLDDPELLQSKLLEEARELAEAREPADVVHEVADVMYFALVALARSGSDLAAVERELDRRERKVIRRPGNAKEVRR
jgi:phosphoribosyl-ATP pyrophosphohydrolase/phosphoribosyl-AMP cyclohydrolase